MKTLLTNGCSWTYGGGIDRLFKDPSNLVWPHHLKKLMGYDNCVNLSWGGGSNQRIFRTTLDWILKQTPETLESTTAVIQWTQWSRKEFYLSPDIGDIDDNEPYYWIACTIHHANATKELNQILLTKDRSVIEDYSNQIKNNHNSLYKSYREIEGFYNYIMCCDGLANIFNNYGIKYYYWDFINLEPNLPEPFLSHILNSHPWLERDTIRHQWDYQRLNQDPGPYGVADDPHPSLLGHKQLAEHIYEAIKHSEQ